MKKFVFLYNFNPKEVPSEEAMQVWMSWFKKIGKNVLDMGNPLMGGMLVTAKKAKKITPAMSPITGYTVIKAKDIEAAIKIAQTCPGKAGMQVYEAMEM